MNIGMYTHTIQCKFRKHSWVPKVNSRRNHKEYCTTVLKTFDFFVNPHTTHRCSLLSFYTFKLTTCCFRHVVIPKEMVKYVPKTHLMSEDEWRSIGIQQSKGWVHYMTHKPGMLLILIFISTTIQRFPTLLKK